jgi:hypothetical protein
LVSNEVEVESGDQSARHVVLSLVTEKGIFELCETTAFESRFPQVPSGMKEIKMWNL